MEDVLLFEIESHTHVATVYLRGPISTSGVVRVMEACDLLPAHVRALRIDARATHESHPGATEAIARVARSWRSARTAAAARELSLPRGAREESRARLDARDELRTR